LGIQRINFLTFLPLGSIISILNRNTNKFLGENIMDVTAKSSSNYSDADIAVLTEEYQLEPTRETVDSLAKQLNKTPRSIIAKLSALGVYQKAERVTKRGEPVIMKAELVSKVQNAIGRELPSLNKMTKVDLQFMIEALVG
jgi:N-methylhydantoinase B/oxoprolinase/acetone carboxylase alpha subunit